MKNLSICYFAFSENYGENHAGFTHTYNITKNLGKYCKRVDVFFSYNQLGLIKQENNVYYHGIVLPKLKSFFKIFSYLKSYFYIKNFVKKSDLIHERFHVNPIDLLFVKNKKYILEINDPAIVLYKGLKSKIYNYLIKKKLNKSNKIITQTNTLKKIINKYINKEIGVISNGVDTEFFNPNIKSNFRDEHNINGNEIIVMFSGGFMQWHGVQDILELAKEFTNVKFILIGKGPMYGEVQSKKLNNLILLGSKPYFEMPKYLIASDILIAPFNTEKFKKLDVYGFWWCPIKLFEYMSMGKPILTYNYEEVKNILNDCALLAKPNDIKDFKEKLNELIKNKKLRLKLGKKSRQNALKYDWNIIAKKTFNFYKKI